MELTNINWADIALFVTSVASLVKAFKSGSDVTKAKNEAAQIRADRDATNGPVVVETVVAAAQWD